MSAFGPINYLRARDLAYAAGAAQGRKGSLGAALGLWQAPTVQDPYQHEPALIAQQKAQERAQQAAGMERQEQLADEEQAFGRNVVLEQLRQQGRGELQGERIEAAEARQKTALEASEAALGKRLGSVEERFAKSEDRRRRSEAARLAFQKAKAEADRDLKRDQGRTTNYLRFLGVGQAQERLRRQAASQDAQERYRKALLKMREDEAKARGGRFDAGQWNRALSQAQEQADPLEFIGKDEAVRAAWVADRADSIYETMKAGPNAPRPELPPAPEPEPEPGFFEWLFGGGKGGPGGPGGGPDIDDLATAGAPQDALSAAVSGPGAYGMGIPTAPEVDMDDLSDDRRAEDTRSFLDKIVGIQRARRYAGSDTPAVPSRPGTGGPPLPMKGIADMERLAARREDAARRAQERASQETDEEALQRGNVPFASSGGQMSVGLPTQAAAFAEDPATGRRVTLADVRGSDATSRAVTLLQQKPPEARAMALAEMQADPEAFRAAGVDVDRVLREAGRL